MAEKKFIICNADEGDPGAYMNRNEIESDPHSLLEGMLIAGFLFRGGETEIDGDDRTVQDFISRSFHFDMKNNSRPSEPRSSLNERYAELLELREEVRRFTSSRLNPRRRHQA